jgi:RNA polymerase sigma-70 factor (ECF subfamily)
MMSGTLIGTAEWMDFEKRLRRFVRSRVDPVWVDDVVGGIMLRLVEHRDALERAANPIAYVLTVATNAVTDHYRRRAVERKALAEAGREEALDADEIGGGDATPEAEIAGCFVGFIQALPETYRSALTLTEIDGLTQREAAARLGLSHSGVKSRVQRGRAMLRKSLLRCCAVEFDRRGGVVSYRRRAGGCGTAC